LRCADYILTNQVFCIKLIIESQSRKDKVQASLEVVRVDELSFVLEGVNVF